ncbi:hypothetical protein F5B18DRAFT_655977 [Nemania serpens]|nr:hypothetical protein F5B18DRAFT_655977 [Nemania serpens]
MAGSKRRRSPSRDEAADTKRARLSSKATSLVKEHATSFLKDKSLGLAASALGIKRSLSDSQDDDLAHKKSKQQDSDTTLIEYAGLTVRNPVIATIDAEGSLITLGDGAASPPTPPPDYSFVAPLPTPDGEKTQDPFSGLFTDKARLGVPSPPITPAIGTAENPFESTRKTGSMPQLPDNHVVMGDVDLFGCIPARLHIFKGQLTKLHPYKEVLQLSAKQVTIGSIFPELKDGPFDAVVLDNPELCYTDVSLDRARLYGTYLETDVIFKGPLQPVQDIIRDIFQQEKPALHVTAHLGTERDWLQPNVPSRLNLRGSFEECSVKVWDVLNFTQLGVEVILDMAGGQDQGVEVGLGFFGKVDITMPGSVVPLKAEYLMRHMNDEYTLAVTLTDDEWRDCFGIKNLTLSEVNFFGVLSEPSSKASLLLQIEAVLELNNTDIVIKGSYSKDEFSLEAYIGNLTLQEVGSIFTNITGHHLDVFDHDVTFNSLSLIVSNEGVALAGSITINGHSTAYGMISIMQDGLHIAGGIGDVTFEDVEIKSASFDVFVSSSSNNSSCARTTRFGIQGEVSLAGIDLSVGLFTEKATGKELQWTIYGEVSSEEEMSIGRLNPDLKGSFLDVGVKGLALIASNKEAPDGNFNKFRYPVKKGIQFCATVESIPQLEDLMRGSVKGMMLCASYEAGGNLRISVTLPAERTISFGDTVYTGPIAIEFAKEGADILLIVKALLNVKVDTQPDPLKFSLGLKAGTLGASAYATMLNEWTNPAGMGQKIKISGCSLEFGIVYATFFTTGMPGSIGLAGQLMIGEKEAKMALKLSQNPKDQVLAAAVTDLGVTDLVRFAGQICEMDLPEPPRDLLHFNKFDLYISTGASIGEIYFPAGASLSGDMLVLGKRAQFNATIGGSGVKLMATIEHFDLGPLTVKGATGPDPIVDIELSSEKQRIYIDGAVELWELSAALHLEAQVFPQTIFDFWVKVELSDWFKFKLAAKLTGDIDFKNLSSLADADFEVAGEMEQHILDNIIDMLDKQINSMHENSDFEAARRRLTDKENEFNAGIYAAQTRLGSAERAYRQKETDTRAELERAKADAEAYLQELRSKALETEQTYVSARAQAVSYKEQVCQYASIAIREAESALYHADHDSDDAILKAQDELHRKRDAFNMAYGSARADIQTAQFNVDDTQAVVNVLNKDIADVDRRINKASLWDMPLLVAEKVAKEVEQAVAGTALEAFRLVLDVAEARLQSPEFLAGEAAVAADEAALETLLRSEAAAVEAAQLSLQETKKTQSDLIAKANHALYDVERSSDQIRASHQAKTAVITAEETARSKVSAAQRAVDELEKSAEYIALEEAKKGLVTAQGKSAEVELARQACDLVEEHSSSFADDILEVGLNIGKWIASAAAELINITEIKFSGSTASFREGGPPLKVKVKGKLVGQDIDIDVTWKPDFDIVKFIKEIFSELWETIKEAAGKFLEAIGAKIVEIAKDVADAVVEGAKAVGEAAEKVGEAVGEAAEAVGEAVGEAAEAVGEAAEQMGEAIGDAVSDVGHAVDDVVSDVGDALSDAGSAIGHAADDVEDAFNSVGNDIDHAMSDVGNAVENVASDVGNAVESVASDIGNAFSSAFDWF